MRIIAGPDFRELPWDNGRGTTREIDRRDERGTMVWRFSLADVAEDGPFSLFERSARVLTVVGGRGLLLDGPTFTLEARPLDPVAFPGDVPVSARRVGGAPVRALNLIFDPARFTARGGLVEGPGRFEGADGAAFLWLLPESGPAGGLRPGDAAVLGSGEAFALPAGARAVALGLDLPL